MKKNHAKSSRQRTDIFYNSKFFSKTENSSTNYLIGGLLFLINIFIFYWFIKTVYPNL